MATKAEIRDRAAQDLGILQLGQALQSQDATRIESAYDEVYAQLKKDGLAVWASSGNTPDEITPHVSALVAENCAGVYGLSSERFQRVVFAASKGKREIRKYATQDFVSQDEATDY